VVYKAGGQYEPEPEACNRLGHDVELRANDAMVVLDNVANDPLSDFVTVGPVA
jgi:hypothetical protein